MSFWIADSHYFPFYVLCIDLIRAPTLQWGSITGGVLSPEKNWCSLTKEKWISKLILSWEPRIPIHVNSALSFYSLIGASQNYLRWIMSPKPGWLPDPYHLSWIPTLPLKHMTLATYLTLSCLSFLILKWEGAVKQVYFERRKLNWKIFSSGSTEHYVSLQFICWEE